MPLIDEVVGVEQGHIVRSRLAELTLEDVEDAYSASFSKKYPEYQFLAKTAIFLELWFRCFQGEGGWGWSGWCVCAVYGGGAGGGDADVGSGTGGGACMAEVGGEVGGVGTLTHF